MATVNDERLDEELDRGEEELLEEEDAEVGEDQPADELPSIDQPREASDDSEAERFYEQRVRSIQEAIADLALSLAKTKAEKTRLEKAFNKAVEELERVNAIKDDRVYLKEKAKLKDIFAKALPYFEKAYELNPKERDYVIALRGISHTSLSLLSP